MDGDRPMANINGTIVRTGETLTADEITFRVVNIGGGTVELQASDPDLEVEVTTRLVLQR